MYIVGILQYLYLDVISLDVTACAKCDFPIALSSQDT